MFVYGRTIYAWLLYLRWFLIPTSRWLYQPWTTLDCFYFPRFVVATYCQERNAKVLIFFNSHCIRTFPFIYKEYWVRKAAGVWRTTGDAKALKWNKHVGLFDQQRIPADHFVGGKSRGYASSEFVRGRGGPERNGTLGK